MTDLLLCVRVVVKNLHWEIWRCHFGKLRQRIQLKCVPHVQHYYISSFNLSHHCFIVSSLPSSMLKLPNWQEKSSVLNTSAKHARETQGTCEVSLSSRVERPVSVSRARVSFPLFFYPPKLETTRSLKWESSCKHVAFVKPPSDLQPLQIDRRRRRNGPARQLTSR